MLITPEKIQAIRERADIVKVIGTHIALRKQGQRYVGLCPFHNEKTPSFSVTGEKGFYYCFGCHAGGDVFSFVMRISGVDFHRAVRILAVEAGVELVPESPAEIQRRALEAKLVEANQAAHAYFMDALWNKSGAPGRAYLQDRGIPANVARQLQLGYGGNSSELFANLSQRSISPEIASQAGYLTDDGKRSLFEDRLIFPIYDSEARLCGFGGRRIKEGNAPKYVNTRDCPLFSKRSLLFGWRQAHEPIRQLKRVIIVEGYTDVIAAQRAGMPNTVAALGTAFTATHAELCGRYVKDAILCLDADAAGIRAMYEAAQKLVAAGIRTWIAGLPPGEDPDSVLKNQGAAALRQCIAGARPAIEYLMDVAFKHSGDTIELRAAAAQKMMPLLSQLSSGIEHDLYMGQLAERVGLNVEQLEKHLRSFAKTIKVPEAQKETPKPAPKPAPIEAKKYTLEVAELEMLRQLLLFPPLRERCGELAEYALSDEMRLLLDKLANTELSLNTVLENYEYLDLAWKNRLLGVEPVAEGAVDDLRLNANRTYQDILTRLKVKRLDVVLQEVLHDLREREAKGEATDELLRRKQELTNRKRTLRDASRSGLGAKTGESSALAIRRAHGD